MLKNSIVILLLFSSLVASPQKRNQKKEDKKVNLAVLPILMYNRSFGGQIGVMANAYFDLNQKDTVSPASNVAFMANYFTNKTYFAGMFSRFYMKEDTWRLIAGTGYGDVKFQTYYEIPADIPIGPTIDEDGGFVDYNTKRFFVFAGLSYKFIPDLYVGIRSVYSKAYTEFDIGIVPDEDLSLFGFGVSVEFDNRDNVFNPRSGQNARLRTMSYLEALGSSNTYHRLNIDYNRYFQLSDNSVLMARFYSMLSVGSDVPFSGKNVVGRDDLRGYTNGKHRANQVYDIQTEYRLNFYKKWGMVAFTGVALATDNWKGDNFSGLLPSLGAGLRYKAIPSRNINIGVEAAVGKEDWGVYFRIGETFTR